MAWKAAPEDQLPLRQFIQTFDWMAKTFRWGKGKPIAELRQPAPTKRNHSTSASPILNLTVQYIRLPRNHRSTDEVTVAALAESIRLVGLQHPIIVQRISEFECELVAGAHRLSAVKMLGWEHIQARVVNPEAAELLSISENIHRFELSQLERSQQIIRWIEITKGGPPSQPCRGGRQPHDLGNSEVARKLGIDRRRVRQAKRHRHIHESVVEVLKKNNIDKLDVLNLVSNLASEAEQLAQVGLIVNDSKSGEINDRDVGIKISYEELVSQWKDCKFKNIYESASAVAKGLFIEKQLRSKSKIQKNRPKRPRF